MSMNRPGGDQSHTTQGTDTAKLKQRFEWLNSFDDSELGELIFLREGDSFASGEEYFDISNPEQGVFHGTAGQQIDEGSRYVAKSQVPDHVWHKLVRSFE